MRMSRHCDLIVMLALVAGCGRAAAGGMGGEDRFRGDGHTRPRAVAADARGDLLYVALSTADRLAVVDVSRPGGGRVVAQLPMCAFPDALAALPGGGVVVACRFDAALRVVTRQGQPSFPAQFQVRVVDAGPEHGHQGMVVDPAGRFAYVAAPPVGGVKIVSLQSGGPPVRTVATGLSPRALHLTPATAGADAGRGAGAMLLLVSNFIGHTVTVHPVQPDGGLSPAVQTIATAAPVLALATISARSAAPGTASQPGPDDDLEGTLLLATHEDRVLSRAHLAVEGLDSVLLVMRRSPPGQATPFIDPGAGKRHSINLTERASDPLVGLDAVAVDPASGTLAVTGAGTDNLLLARPRERDLLSAPARAVGTHPTALAFLPGGRLVTADHLSDTLSVLAAAGAGNSLPMATERNSETIAVGLRARITPAERGEVLFYSRALVPNNVATGPLSVYTCAACHVDGQIDGRLHPSKRNKFFSMTKTCRGLLGTEPFLSLGKPATFASFADNIVATHAQGALEAPETFDRYPVALRLWSGRDWGRVTLSADQVRAALAAYMARIPVEPSPFVTPGRRTLDPAERRGLAVFRANCAGCHQLFRSTARERAIPAAELERRLLAGEVALTSARLYDVGTPVLGEGGNNPPSLRNVWAAAPYFSDGSAPTLEALLLRTNPQAPKVHAPENGRAGVAALSGRVRADLLAFLRAL